MPQTSTTPSSLAQVSPDSLPQKSSTRMTSGMSSLKVQTTSEEESTPWNSQVRKSTEVAASSTTPPKETRSINLLRNIMWRWFQQQPVTSRSSMSPKKMELCPNIKPTQLENSSNRWSRKSRLDSTKEETCLSNTPTRK